MVRLPKMEISSSLNLIDIEMGFFTRTWLCQEWYVLSILRVLHLPYQQLVLEHVAVHHLFTPLDSSLMKRDCIGKYISRKCERLNWEANI